MTARPRTARPYADAPASVPSEVDLKPHGGDTKTILPQSLETPQTLLVQHADAAVLATIMDVAVKLGATVVLDKVPDASTGVRP